jgi:uncharacterized Zn finger protein (UPF0148 family)
LELFEPDPSPLRAWVGARILEFHGPRRSPVLGLSVAIAPVALFIATMFVGRLFFSTVSQNWMLIVWALLIVVYGLCANRLAAAGLQRENERIVQTAAGLGICPTCGYDLLGLEPAADGCIECPECNAAWKASRVLRSSPLVLSDANTAEIEVYKRRGKEGLFALAASMWWDRDDRGKRTPSTARNLRDRIAAESESGLCARMRHGGKARGWPAFRRQMLAEGLCPSCAWDLQSIARQTDGKVECPICTAAWNASDTKSQ